MLRPVSPGSTRGTGIVSGAASLPHAPEVR